MLVVLADKRFSSEPAFGLILKYWSNFINKSKLISRSVDLISVSVRTCWCRSWCWLRREICIAGTGSAGSVSWGSPRCSAGSGGVSAQAPLPLPLLSSSSDHPRRVCHRHRSGEWSSWNSEYYTTTENTKRRMINILIFAKQIKRKVFGKIYNLMQILIIKLMGRGVIFHWGKKITWSLPDDFVAPGYGPYCKNYSEHTLIHPIKTVFTWTLWQYDAINSRNWVK